jgi:excisionase family DNA binding protein
MDDHLRELMRQAVEDAIDAKLGSLVSHRDRPEHPEYLTTKEAARIARVEPDTVRDWLKSGRLARHGTTRHLLVRLDQLEAFLSTAATGESEPTDEALEARAIALVGGTVDA